MSYSARNLDLTRDGQVHLGAVSFDLPASGICSILGRTLAGKSTLLKVVAGLQAPDGGTLERNGRDLLQVPAWNRRVGMVYQQFINYPHLSVGENIAFPLRRARLSANLIEDKLNYVTDLLGLRDFLSRRPAELSGGQQQRVALARSLVKDADLLLLDEPLVNLDYKLREQLRDEFRRIFQSNADRLVLYATTEPQEAMIMQGMVIVMHEGRVLQTGDCREVYHSPATMTVARVFNDPPMNLVAGSIEGGRVRIGDTVDLDVPEHLRALGPGPYVFGVRASDVELNKGDMRARVVLSEVNGSQTVLHLERDGLSLVLEEEGVHIYAPGDVAGFFINQERLFAFDAQTEALLAAPRVDRVSGPRG